MPVDDANLASLAAALDRAHLSRVAVEPLSERFSTLDVAEAYAIQNHWSNLRIARGEVIVGRKIGLTSVAVQRQLGVSEPDYGALWRSSFYETRGGVIEAPAADFLQPQVEGEVAFLIKHPLAGPSVTAADVIAATEACALAVEIVDSRIANWRIKLVDTIADNASFGGFGVGPWDKAMQHSALDKAIMRIARNGEQIAEGEGAAVLGHPANSTAWLVNKLGEFGVALRPGDIVISGALTKMSPAKRGDEFTFALTGQPDLRLRFV